MKIEMKIKCIEVVNGIVATAPKNAIINNERNLNRVYT